MPIDDSKLGIWPADPLDAEIRKLLADILRGPELKAYFGFPCTKLARNMESGHDMNPRTLAALIAIRKLSAGG